MVQDTNMEVIQIGRLHMIHLSEVTNAQGEHHDENAQYDFYDHGYPDPILFF